MKWIIRISLTFVSLVIGAVFFLQSPFVKNLTKEKLIAIAKDLEVDLTIEKIDGILPFEVILNGVKCSYSGETIAADSFKFRLAILPLLQKKLEISYLKVKGGCYREIPFKAAAKGILDLTGDEPIQISHFLIEGEELFIRLDGKINPDLSIKEGNLAFYLPDLSVFRSEAKGSCMGMVMVSEQTAHLECYAENLILRDIPLAYSSLALDAERGEKLWVGGGQISSGHPEIPLDAKWEFSFDSLTQNLSISDFQLVGPDLSLIGKMECDLAINAFEGFLFAKCHDIQVFRPLFPDIPRAAKNLDLGQRESSRDSTIVNGSILEIWTRLRSSNPEALAQSKFQVGGRAGYSLMQGRTEARFEFSYSEGQDLEFQIEGEDLTFSGSTCESLLIESTLHDLFGRVTGQFSLQGKYLSLLQMELSEFELNSTLEPHSSPFEFVATGSWKNPLEIRGKGSFQRQPSGVMFNIDKIEGFAQKIPFSLQTPFAIDWDSKHFKVTNFSMNIDYGHLFARIDLNHSNSLIKISGQKVPLAWVPVPTKHTSLTGTTTFDLDLISWEEHIQGTCNIAFERANFLSQGLKEAFPTKGSVQMHFSDHMLQIHGELKAKEGQFISLDGSLPIQYRHYPFLITFDPEAPFAAELVAEGKLEDLFNFINVGHHRIEGWVSTKLHGSKTLGNPYFQGTLELQDGIYENYYTGTCLKKVYATAIADKQTLQLTSLRATDGDEGTCTAEGLIHLKPREHFPFVIAAELENLNAISFDTIVGKFSGQLIISDDSQGALARGNLKVSETTFRIPDQLPTSLPQLPIHFINPPLILAKKRPPSEASPLQLDIHLDVPKKGKVEGRGLNAELKGNLHITGTYTDIVAKGQLQLVSGEYLFSGKVFKLTEGELIFSDQPSPSAYLSLRGICDLPEVNVIALLQGPLTSPKLTFQSSPQLPTSSILSQILFNKDISEISAVQALQVAQTVISLSGSSAPDLLEKIRKTIGMDRLTLITSESDPGKISIQIGKYLMQGVLLTVSQGAESRNVSVEVDLKKGIKFQAEFNEEQQGKFSLKWHHHY